MKLLLSILVITNVHAQIELRAVNSPNGQIDLIDMDTIVAGTLFVPEVKYQGKWYMICGGDFSGGFAKNNNGATKVCNMLGFADGGEIFDHNTYSMRGFTMPVGMCKAGEPLDGCTAGSNHWGQVAGQVKHCQTDRRSGFRMKCIGDRTSLLPTPKLDRPAFQTKFPVNLGSARNLGFYDSSFTAMADVYRNSYANNNGDQTIFGTNAGSKGKGLHLVIRSGKYHMGFYGIDCNSGFASQKGKWKTVAFVYDKAAQTQTIVEDGVVRKTCTNKSPFMGTSTVRLGRWKGDNRHNFQGVGSIKNVKIFDVALTKEQIIEVSQGDVDRVAGNIVLESTAVVITSYQTFFVFLLTWYFI